MAKNAKMIKSSDGNKLAIVNPDAAGIDIADAEMQVCVPEDRDGDNNRRFGSFTCELNEIITLPSKISYLPSGITGLIARF